MPLTPPPALGLPAVPLPVVDGVRRLAILRSGGLGDLIGAEPAIAALRATYADAEITVLGAAQHRPLVEGRPGPWDRFVEVPPMPGIKVGTGPDAPAELVEDWYAAQRGYGYDLAVQLHGGGGNSNRLLRRLGARVTAGAATADAPKPDRWVPYTPASHDTLRWLEVAMACGAPPLRLEPVLTVTSADRTAAAQVLPDATGPLLAVHPGASHPRRRWPPARLGAVADRLVGCGAAVAVLGGPGDDPLVEQVCAAMSVPTMRLADLSLPALLGVLDRADLFLGNDSGPRHLAAAVGTPTVGVFSNANLADVAPLTRSWHRIAVSWGSACAACGRRIQEADCGHGATALDDVPVDEVAALALELWDQVQAAVVRA